MKGGQSQRVEYQTHSQALETTSTKMKEKEEVNEEKLAKKFSEDFFY